MRDIKDFVSDVENFHDKFEIPLPNHPVLLEQDVFEYRYKFLQEELHEFALAYEADNYIDMVDALLDLIYVAIGTLLLMGLKSYLIRNTWAEVQRANITKERATHAGESKRGHAFDVIKPFGWQPPNHDAIFEKFGITIPSKKT